MTENQMTETGHDRPFFDEAGYYLKNPWRNGEKQDATSVPPSEKDGQCGTGSAMSPKADNQTTEACLPDQLRMLLIHDLAGQIIVMVSEKIGSPPSLMRDI